METQDEFFKPMTCSKFNEFKDIPVRCEVYIHK